MVASIVGVSATAVWAPTAGMPFQPGIPAGVAAGDVFTVPIFARTGGATINLMSGYTLLTPDNQTDSAQATGEVQAKIAGSSEPSPSVQSSIADTQPTGAVILAIRGAAALASWVVPTPNVGASSSPPAPDGVATADNSLVVRIYMMADDNTIVTPPAGHTQVFFELTGQGSDALMAIFVANSTVNNGGSAGVATCVFSGSDPYWAGTFIIPPGNAAFETLTDGFASLDTNKWPSNYGGTAVSGGQAVVDCDVLQFSGFRSLSGYHLGESHVGGQFNPPAINGGTSAYMSIVATSRVAGTDAAFNIDTGFMGVLLRSAFSDPGAVFVPYDPVDHAWLRFREASGTLHWESSADGASWSTLRTETSPSWVDDPDLTFVVECKRADGTDNTGSFDNVNIFGTAGVDVADRGLGASGHGPAAFVARSVGSGANAADTVGPMGPAAGSGTSRANGATRGVSVGGWAASSPSQTAGAGASRGMFGGALGVMPSPARSSSAGITRGMAEASGWLAPGLARSIATEPSDGLPPDMTVSPWGVDVLTASPWAPEVWTVVL